MCYNLMNTVTQVFCVVVSLSHSMPSWKVLENSICGSGNGVGCPAHPLRASNTQNPLMSTIKGVISLCIHHLLGERLKCAVHGYCSNSQTSHGLVTLRRMETCSWDLSVQLGESHRGKGRSV